MCEYKFHSGKRCKEEALPNSKCCILHTDFPEDEESEEFKRLNGLKEEKVKEKISKGDFDFEGAKLFKVDFSEMVIEKSKNLIFSDTVIGKDAEFFKAKMYGKASFEGAKIRGDAWFSEAEIGGDVWFGKAEIGGDALFEGAKIRGDALFTGAKIISGNVSFKGAEIGGDVLFKGAKIGGDVLFKGAKIGGAKKGGDASFEGAKIGGDVLFKGAKIGRDASFIGAKIGGDASFEGAKIGGDASFSLTEIKGSCSFKNVKFKIPVAQEVACRTARKTQESIGDRVLADYHFYREMEAKRKQKYKKYSLKPILKLIRKLRVEKLVGKHTNSLEKERSIYWGFLELPVQYIFGYGVHPWRVIATWLLTVFALAFVYWIGNGVEAANSMGECLYFSVVTAATPGYGGYQPKPGIYQGLATIEAIFGTFMWAAFIAIFARKYMR